MFFEICERTFEISIHLTGKKYINNMVFMAADVSMTDTLKKDVLEITAHQHRFDPADTDAIGMWDTTESAKFMQTFMLAFRIFLGVIGCLTMVVGGIGVSNIMTEDAVKITVREGKIIVIKPEV